ncbi:unannotated protein [freshwater metagenome]|uniref:Unannotated protein n=1 Tax=freshwater metagenome TaxID=449393 RepID=A0A6J6LE30_9ZZZZ
MIADEADVEPAPAAEPLSTITTDRPALASSRATAPPITPAPITTTSVFILLREFLAAMPLCRQHC